MMAPTSSLSLSIGTATMERAPPYVAGGLGFGSVDLSTTWSTALVRKMRLRRSLTSGLNGPRDVCNSTNAAGVPVPATRWNNSPSKRNNVPNLASQIRVAFSSIA